MPTSTTILHTATTYFEAISALDTTLLSSVLTDDYQHTFGLESAGFGLEIDHAGTVARFAALRDVLSSLPTRIQQAWPNEGAKQVTVWVTGQANFHSHVKQDDDGDEAWSYRNEYIFVLTMDASGEKISRAFEFVDSKGTDKMVILVGKAFERVKACSGDLNNTVQD